MIRLPGMEKLLDASGINRTTYRDLEESSSEGDP